MRIVHVTLRFDAPGGVETTVREVTRGLRRCGEDIRVFASDLYDETGWQRRTDFAPEVDGVPVVRFPARRRLTGINLPLMPGLIDALAASGAEIIHAHSHRYGHVLQSAAVAHRLGVPFVVSLHYHPAHPYEPAFKKGLLRLQDVGFGWTAYRAAQALVVETELEARLVREFAPGDRIHVIPPGIDLARWTVPEPERLPDGLPPEFLLFAGRLAPSKGLGELLAAYARVPPAHRVPLVLMGRDWGERARLEREAERLSVRPEVVFLGHIADRAVYRSVFRRARAFVLTSEWEAFGLVLLEAMAVGLPIVATAVGAVPEVLDGGRAGQLVPLGDVEALARALTSVLSEPSAHAEGVANGRARVRAFDWTVSIERLRALYGSLRAG